MKTGIIIPCYNEEKRLNVTAFVSFIQKATDFHLCFVNDGSKDDTIGVLKKIQSEPKVTNKMLQNNLCNSHILLHRIEPKLITLKY